MKGLSEETGLLCKLSTEALCAAAAKFEVAAAAAASRLSRDCRATPRGNYHAMGGRATNTTQLCKCTGALGGGEGGSSGDNHRPSGGGGILSMRACLLRLARVTPSTFGVRDCHLTASEKRGWEVKYWA